MDGDDVAGAEAAARYFALLFPFVYASGDLDEWESLSHEDCIFCTSVIDDVNELQGMGGYRAGGQVEVLTVEGSSPMEGNDYFRVDLEIEEGASTERRPNSQNDVSSGGHVLLIMAVGRSSDGWIIREVQVEEVDEGP